jgi:hypothetical protein
VVLIQIAQRWMNFAIANPARQALFTVVTREGKYRAKTLIDVAISIAAPTRSLVGGAGTDGGTQRRAAGSGGGAPGD